MSGSNVIVDADALIGLLNETDQLHARCLRISTFLQKQYMNSLIPYPIVLEAATALAKDKTIRRPDLAQILLKKYAAIDDNRIETADIPLILSQLYDPKTSKKNTPFDYYVLACAKKNNISTVFSFDAFYKKHGLTLAEELLSTLPQ